MRLTGDRKKISRNFLSLRYGADLARSRLLCYPGVCVYRASCLLTSFITDDNLIHIWNHFIHFDKTFSEDYGRIFFQVEEWKSSSQEKEAILESITDEISEFKTRLEDEKSELEKRNVWLEARVKELEALLAVSHYLMTSQSSTKTSQLEIL